ncbi:hypothetical protein Aduo_012585 [Ancylostoma duodenale]
MLDVSCWIFQIPRNDLFASDRARLTIMKLHQMLEHFKYDFNVPNVILVQDHGCEQICTVNYKVYPSVCHDFMFAMPFINSSQ